MREPTPDSSIVQQSIDHVEIGNYSTVTIRQSFNQTQIFQISVDEITTRSLILTSPYQGLKSFEPGDKDRFFGRDQQLLYLTQELERTNIVMLLGASGSGKSSMVKAGLIPYFAAQKGSQLVSLLFTPDQDPFESLYAALLSRYKQAEADIARSGNTNTLLQIVKILKQPEEFWLIFIDQFEEVFTTTSDNRRKIFLSSLVQLARSNIRSLKIIATMRTDFLDQLSPFPDLVRMTNPHRPMIADMHPDELSLAIEQPAAQQGVVFEAGLVETIIQEVQGQAGYLPLLQYTLDLLWESEVQQSGLRDRTLHLATYRKLGGVRGALQQHVEATYTRLSHSEQQTARYIFLKLVGIGGDDSSETDWKPVRRRALQSEFDQTLEKKVLAQLINHKLIVSDNPTQQPQAATVEIAHEILLTSWATLKNWMQKNRQAIALRNRLNGDVTRWKAQKSDEELWSGSKLEQALQLNQDATFKNILGGFNQDAQKFLAASAILRTQQKRHARQTSQRMRMSLAALLVMAVGSGSYIWQNRPQEPLQALQTSMQEADRLNQAKNWGAVSKYRNILAKIPELETDVKRFPQNFQSDALQTLELLKQTAEASIADMVERDRFPQLRNYLKQRRFGHLRQNDDIKLTDFDKQYEANTALQTTYTILMMDKPNHPGIGADLNENGLIDSPGEANLIPCQTLKAMQELWRKYTQNQCDWFSTKSYLLDADCKTLQGYTLTFLVFEATTVEPYIADRFQACQVVPASFLTSQKASK